MKTQKAYLLVLVMLSLSLHTVRAQTKQSFQSVLTVMNTEQINLARENKLTKAEVLSLEKVMAASGNQLIAYLKESAGETPQKIIDKIEVEFKNLNAEYSKILSGSSLTAWKDLSNASKTTLVKKLQSDLLNTTKVARTDILTDLKNGIQSSLIKGFGGEDWGRQN